MWYLLLFCSTDLAGIKISDLMGDTLLFLKNASRTAQNYYVERCKLVLILNAPFFFSMIWAAISPILNENTRKKISVVSGDYRAELLKHISDDQIPSEYGGSGGTLGSGSDEISFRNFVLSLNGSAVRQVHVSAQGAYLYNSFVSLEIYFFVVVR